MKRLVGHGNPERNNMCIKRKLLGVHRLQNGSDRAVGGRSDPSISRRRVLKTAAAVCAVMGLAACGGAAKASASDFPRALGTYRVARAEFITGNPEGMLGLFSHQQDVTLGSPLGPFVRGYNQVAQAATQSASLYSEGQVIGFENIATYATHDLAFIVEVERYKVRFRGGELAPAVLRTTTIFRREDGIWKIVHRLADLVPSAQPPKSPSSK